MSSPDSSLKALRRAARAYLEWEAELTGFGVPEFDASLATTSPDERAARLAPASETMVVPPATSAAPVAVPSVASLSTSAAVAPAAVMPPPEPSIVAPAREEPAEVRAPLAALGAAPPGPAESASDRPLRLAQIAEEVRSCTRCELHKGRRQTVFARGAPDASLLFIGEGPGQEEDRSGIPFVGPAGQLLDRMIAAMGFGRDDVYVCNVVKCRPPGNRTPLPSEAGACAPFLLGQLDVVRPRVIVALGRCATENLGLVGGGGPWRGRWGTFRGIPVMPTYHPAFLLRSPEFKRPVWEDLQKVMSRLKEAP